MQAFGQVAGGHTRLADPVRACAAALGCALTLALAPAAHALTPSGPPPLKQSPKCNVPFPDEALAQAPAGFRGEAMVLISFNVRGEFRSARLMRSSGNEALDDAALRASVGARCEALGDVNDTRLTDSLIGIPFAFTFDRTQSGASAGTAPRR